MSEPIKFPLALESVVFTKLNFETIFEHNQGSGENKLIIPNNNVAVQEVPDRKNTLVVQLTTQINLDRSKDLPYLIDVACLAFFIYDENMPIDEAKRAATITGHNVCYGAIRESVSWITSRLPYGQIALGLSVLQPPKPQNDESKAE
jgi:preprotein translocase subunit SecB